MLTYFDTGKLKCENPVKLFALNDQSHNFLSHVNCLPFNNSYAQYCRLSFKAKPIVVQIINYDYG